jgi:hypothetical protein
MRQNRNAAQPAPLSAASARSESGMEKFLQYLFTRLKDVRPVTHKVGEQEYAVQADGTIGQPIRALAPQWDKPTFTVETLSALKALYEAQVDGFGEDVGLHVSDYLNVRLVALKADDFGRRHVFAHATHKSETPFRFGEYLKAEDFLIQLRTSFLFNENAVKVQQLCSNLESGVQITLADDGLSQAIEAKAGTTSKAKVEIPGEGISLIPWRTFRDASPVSSNFLLRFKGVKDELPLIALFEVDQKWKLDTVNSIAQWLRTHIKDAKVIA